MFSSFFFLLSASFIITINWVAEISCVFFHVSLQMIERSFQTQFSAPEDHCSVVVDQIDIFYKEPAIIMEKKCKNYRLAVLSFYTR